MKPTTIKKLLDEVIFKVTSTPSAYAYNPKKDFSKSRKPPFQTIVEC